jgi:hypothetical protein
MRLSIKLGSFNDDKSFGFTCEDPMKLLITFLLTFSSHMAFARSYVIFNMVQDLPMGFEGEGIRKNYYVNIGVSQGLKKDSILSVFRMVSVQNPYDNMKRENFKVKIGELKVIHSSTDASITMVNEYEKEDVPIFELNQFMIGDHVAISVD